MTGLVVIQDHPGHRRRHRYARATAFAFNALLLNQTLHRYLGPLLTLSLVLNRTRPSNLGRYHRCNLRPRHYQRRSIRIKDVRNRGFILVSSPRTFANVEQPQLVRDGGRFMSCADIIADKMLVLLSGRNICVAELLLQLEGAALRAYPLGGVSMARSVRAQASFR